MEGESDCVNTIGGYYCTCDLTTHIMIDGRCQGNHLFLPGLVVSFYDYDLLSIYIYIFINWCCCAMVCGGFV